MITVTYTAKYFGVSVEKDAWLLVYVTITSFCQFLWGPINETFRAKFIFIREQEGERIAIKYCSSLITFVVIITAITIFLLGITYKPISNFMAKDLTSYGVELYGILLLIMLPSMLITELTNISISILNAFEIFYVPEIVGSITALIYLGIIIWLSPVIGIYTLAVGQYFNLFVLMIILWVFLKRLDKFSVHNFFRFKFSYVKPFILYALPFFLPYAVSQLNGLSERWLAGILGIGNISMLDYSRQFSNILQGVLSGILTTVMIPLLSKAFAQNNYPNFHKIFIDNISTIYIIMALAIPLLFGASEPLCQFLFLRGDVTMDNIHTISFLCKLFSIAFLGIIIYLLFGYSLLASGKGKIYAYVGVGCQIGVLTLNLGFITIFGLIVIPISVGVIHLIAGIIMWEKSELWSSSIIRDLIKYHLIIVILSIGLSFLNNIIPYSQAFIKLIIESIVLIGCVGILSSLFGFNLYKVLINKIRH